MKNFFKIEEFWGWVVIISMITGVLMMQGCYADQALISDLPDLDNIEVKMTFSPDGDGVNDTWAPTTEQDWDKYAVHLNDKYGNLVWFSDDPSEKFDGKIGREWLTEPYFFFVIFAKKDGRKYYKDGILVNELYITETY